MTKRRRGHHVRTTHVDLDNDFDVVRRKSSRVSTARQEDEERRVEERRKYLEKLRDELKSKIDESTLLMDAPGGLEFDQDFEANEALYDFIEDQLHEGRDEMEDFVIVDDDGDQEFEDIAPLSGRESGRDCGFASFQDPDEDSTQRRDRIERENANWEYIYDKLYTAYLEWDANGPPVDFYHEQPSGVYNDETTAMDSQSQARHSPIACFHMHKQELISFPLTEDTPISVTMVRYGYMPTAPFHPGYGVSIKVLEIYHAVSRRCSNVGVQPFVHSICDLHKIAFRTGYARSFSRAYDVYLELRHRVDTALDHLLFATEFDRYNQMCPCCTNCLPDEEQMTFRMLIALDGNESLKRNQIQRRIIDRNGKQTGVVNVERKDTRTRRSSIFLEAESVDKYKNEVKRSKSHTGQDALDTSSPNIRMPPKADQSAGKVSSQMAPGTEESDINDSLSRNRLESGVQEGYPTDGSSEATPCIDRWSNLSEDSKKKMWGTFDETGVFVASCRHGVVLLLCDMIKSGELAKYPLALTDRLIELFGERLMIGYDIGCGFSSTAKNSKLVGPKVASKKCHFCVGSFHGHAHERACQLQWHPLYIEGTGLEDFESCERVFSESNRVAAVTRHASKFHRRQAILKHFDRWNSDKYSELSRFLINNYKQALGNISDLTPKIERTAADLRIDSPAETFPLWRDEELQYLKESRASIPKAKETLELDYLGVLKKLEAAEASFENNTLQWVEQQPSGFHQGLQSYGADASETRRMENAKMRGLDSVLTLQAAARTLEAKLEIEARWTRDSDDWKRVDKSWQQREFDKAVNRLEGLVIVRIFELEKMNQTGLCYKLRTHISKALKSRSKAISSAVKAYNDAAARVGQPTLILDQVMKFVFVGEFDLIRMSRFGLSGKPWSRKAEREVAVDFFKLQRSLEEIRRLNIEIRRLHVHVFESEVKMQCAVDSLERTDPNLAVQMKKRQSLLRSKNIVHSRRLEEIESWPTFTGDRDPLRAYRSSSGITSVGEECSPIMQDDHIERVRDAFKYQELDGEPGDVDRNEEEDQEEDRRETFASLASVVDVLSACESTERM